MDGGRADDEATDGGTTAGDTGATLQTAVAAVESVGDVLAGLAAQAWRPTLPGADRQAAGAESAETCRWARVVVLRAIDVAASDPAATAEGVLYGPLTGAEAVGRFRYLLDAVEARLATAA